MAKHEGMLIADIDDGYAKVSNLLMEALCCMPLSASELRIVMFIMRRTYGWAKSTSRNTGKFDIITAAEMSGGTGIPKRTIQDSLASLVNNNIIHSIKINNSNIKAYGINPDVHMWGGKGPIWAASLVALKEARDSGVYSKSTEEVPGWVYKRAEINAKEVREPNNTSTEIPVDLYGDYSIPIRDIPYTYTEISVDQQAISPCDTRPDGVPTDSITDITTNDSNNLPQDAPAVPDDNELELVPPPGKAPAKSPPKPKGKPDENKPEKEITPHVKFAEETWILFNQELPCHKDTYAAAAQFVNEHGKPGADKFLKWLQENGLSVVPEGAKPEVCIPATIRRGKSRSYKWEENAKPKQTQPQVGGFKAPATAEEMGKSRKAKL